MTRSKTTQVLAVCLALCLVPTLAAAGEPASPAAEAFERLKKLEGNWQGTSADGQPIEVRYSLTGGGSALVESFRLGDHPEMLTVYHLDGESILLTHYCMAGNQPRMRATAFPAGGELRFDHVDVSNLESPEAGHMHHALIRYDGGDQMSSAWTYRKDGAEAFTEESTIERVVEMAAKR